jgi:hypothetical protein
MKGCIYNTMPFNYYFSFSSNKISMVGSFTTWHFYIVLISILQGQYIFAFAESLLFPVSCVKNSLILFYSWFFMPFIFSIELELGLCFLDNQGFRFFSSIMFKKKSQLFICDFQFKLH